MGRAGRASLLPGLVLLGSALATVMTAQGSGADPVIAGVVTTFEVTPATVATSDTVAVTLRMTNTGPEPITFRYSSCLQEHVDLVDALGMAVPRRAGAPALECPTLDVPMAPRATAERVMRFRIGDYYALAPGHYELRFKYDVRLLGRTSGSPWTAWSRKGVPIVVMP